MEQTPRLLHSLLLISSKTSFQLAMHGCSSYATTRKAKLKSIAPHRSILRCEGCQQRRVTKRHKGNATDYPSMGSAAASGSATAKAGVFSFHIPQSAITTSSFGRSLAPVGVFSIALNTSLKP